MPSKEFNYRSFLKEELIERQQKNPSYSLRAYARDLGVPVSRISEILNGKNGMSQKRALDISERLKLNHKDQQLFLDLVQMEHGRSKLEKQQARSRVQAKMDFSYEIENHEFSIISEWYHLPILELLKLPSQNTEESIAKKLGLEKDTVRTALHKLAEMGLVQTQYGSWTTVQQEGTIKSGFPSKSVRNYQRQLLEKALAALTERPLDERDFSSAVFVLNKKQVQHAKERIKQFRRSLMRELEGFEDPEAVYCLSLQLFELTVS